MPNQDEKVAQATRAAVTALTEAILWPDRPHAFVDSGTTQAASDGRVMRRCSVCGKPPNAGRHHPGARPHGPVPAEHIGGRHAYVAGEETKLDARGYRRVLCASCGGPANSPRHRTITALADYRPGEYRRSAAEAVGVFDREAAPAPTHRPPTTGRRRTIPAPTTPGEYVAAALAIDRILALPADLVPWRLRLRLAEVRPLLDVPDYPVLAGPQGMAEPDPDAPPHATEEAIPQLRPKVLAVAPTSNAVGIIRGIRSDRIKTLARRAQDQGWDVSLTGSGHLRLAKGSQVIIGSTTAETGSGHGWGNLRAQARRAGLDVTGL